MKQKNPFKIGDKVIFKDEIDNILISKKKKIFVVYAIYSKTKLSLGLRGYPDTEQDYQTDINKIEILK